MARRYSKTFRRQFYQALEKAGWEYVYQLGPSPAGYDDYGVHGLRIDTFQKAESEIRIIKRESSNRDKVELWAQGNKVGTFSIATFCDRYGIKIPQPKRLTPA